MVAKCSQGSKSVLCTLGTLLALCFALSCHAGSFGYVPPPTNYPVSLAWSPSPDATGYRIYFGPVSQQQTNYVDVGNVTACTLQRPMPTSKEFYYVVAYNQYGIISAPSNEVWFPGDVWTFFFDLCSTNLINWTPTNLPLAFKQPAGAAFFVRPGVSNWTDYGNPQ